MSANGSDLPQVELQTFKSVMAQWTSGVTVVTSRQTDVPVGMTVSSFASVSLHPPLVLICVNRQANTYEAICASGSFAVNLLAVDQQEWGMRFAGLQPEVTDRFAGIDWHPAQTGAPILPGVLGWLDCYVQHAYAGGDHTIFVGAVAACEVETLSAPLVYFRRTWRQLADPV